MMLLEFLLQYWLIVAVLVAITFVLLFVRLAVTDTDPPYEKRGSLVTETELKLYKSLQAAIGGSWTLFTMIRLAEVIKVRRNAPGGMLWRNQISTEQLAFVVCHNDTLNVLLVIELEDSSPEAEQFRERDHFVAAALASAGLPLLRVPLADSYDKIDLRKQLDEILREKKKK